ncbi:hypothetical protein ES703_118444 [subsurface metagenome]
MYKRICDLELSRNESVFLWGPRQTGKSTLLKALFPEAPYYDLLLSEEYRRLVAHPEILREECLAQNIRGGTQRKPVVIDEVQNEVHGLIENRGIRFVLCGSSARKLKRGQRNLLGGRAVRYELFPLVYPEMTDLTLSRALTSGLLPRHYLADDSFRLLQSYVGDYLREEIAAEALTRNIPAFSRFLEVAALTNGELVNYSNIARECGLSAPTVQSYFQILEDTLIGSFLPTFRHRMKRRTIGAPKFYFFDVGIVGSIVRRGRVLAGSELFGRAFEHFLYMELRAHSSYSGLFYPISFWRTASGFEVDFILGDHQVAIEVKATERAQSAHLKGLRAFKEEIKAKDYLLITQDPRPRNTDDGIQIVPWRRFLGRLWNGDIIRS